MEFLYEYGLFFAKTVTFVIAIAVVLMLIVASAVKPKSKKGEIEIEDVSEKLNELKESFLHNTLSKKELKAHQKQLKAQSKKSVSDEPKPRLYVVDFTGSMDAHEVESLREEVTAIISIADPKTDKVLVRLESGGGVVHGYGLAASQLQRIKSAGIPLSVAIDKVAASGGYMMACVADEILAAPFAIVGSIGVIAQIPNFNKILKKNDVDFEQITAGEFKRTLTLFGENTDKAREKFRDEIEETHGLFKTFVSTQRPSLNIDLVATGEHWFATQAIDKGLIDVIKTSDDALLEQQSERQIYKVKYKVKKGLSDKLALGLSSGVNKVGVSLLSKFKSMNP
ncbi:protease SohB [Pseudoalteromonas carrageenovora]|uniref:Putative inner membrane peptidase n=1 Tax=Pseudoalteromonas carrageenovora IAM 12662 TaxID=1314868 RepID=A0A2K4X8Q1_PSEVC|nr:protease SohB [Pseudoalteromonas carrageenovora]MBE0383040.1 serine protease SohB [Pseudoalteromonas carrageenovora IAM 12662]MDO6464738.1 protease SohB [Pseudoalteromonas carrageenovora]MDO6545849.1 protease SohB [Pseudoalteromonas carrageenovora]MDO6830223.1 protease SohB [Pseudoalteromonas carrageenovora]QBJ71615.1 SohB protein [Pseudoalteromonas carrageenovora]